MKYSNGMTRFLPGVAVLLLFCCGATCQAIAMKRSDMGPVYILVLGLEAAAAFLLSIVVLGERATMARVFAVALIAGGIVLLERS